MTALHLFPLPYTLALPSTNHRITTMPTSCWKSLLVIRERLMYSNFSGTLCGILFMFQRKTHTHLDFTFLWIRIDKKILARGVCFPQSCSSTGCRFAALRSYLNYPGRRVSLFSQKTIFNVNYSEIPCLFQKCPAKDLVSDRALFSRSLGTAY